MGDVWESDGVVVETWESSTEPGVTFTTVIREGDIVTGGSGGDLSDAAPQDLGTAAAGTSEDASRADHVHDMPNAADIAVDASGFNGNLTTSDDTVQEIAQKLDDLVIPAAGIADPGGANDDILQRKAGAWTHRTVAQVKSDLSIPAPLVSDLPIGAWTGLPAVTLANTSTNMVLSGTGRGNATPIYLPAGTYDRIAVWVTSGGTATLRLGLYNVTSSGGFGSVALDAGTVSTASTGLRAVTISHTVAQSGWFWAAVYVDAYTSAFMLTGFGDNSYYPTIGFATTEDINLRQRIGWSRTQDTPTGTSLPASWNPSSLALVSAKVVLRRSA